MTLAHIAYSVTTPSASLLSVNKCMEQLDMCWCARMHVQVCEEVGKR